MTVVSVQSQGTVVLIRPHRFTPNSQTADDNTFQPLVDLSNLNEHHHTAHGEVTVVAETLRANGITVHLFEDEHEGRPDSVFPNNWFSTHAGGHIAVYPMRTPNRRTERRQDILELLKQNYRVQDVIDYSGLEFDGIYLEGTGAMVLDHVSRVAYVARSQRADPVALERFCTNFGYEPLVFDAVDDSGIPIYHTNVMMCVGTRFALIGLELMTSRDRRDEVVERLTSSGRTVIELSSAQIKEFCGNAIELEGDRGRILALSRRAFTALTERQRETLEESCRLVPVDVPTIELAGGSIRCMLAGIHLDRRRHQDRWPTSAPAPFSALGARQ
ncbi:amidinotransferase [Cryobacterium sp. MDB1-18-2]|nr:amidinotransferase [Cryobacterium sp. MDB1-18-2]TFC46369.1 amidinotransferase [Cryobacterium sp. MDB1-18-1]